MVREPELRRVMACFVDHMVDRVMFTSSHYDTDSTNFFDVEKEFFVIDSENLDKVQSKFYGFAVQETGIFEEANMTEEALANLDGCGCYISITRDELPAESGGV